jgi:autotransporter family porin
MRTLRTLTIGAVALLLAGCASAAADTSSPPPTAPAQVSTGPVTSPKPSRSPSHRPTTTPRPSASPSTHAPSGGPAHFGTLPPSAKLPTDAQCASWVLAKPLKENKGVNKKANHATGQHVDGSLFAGDNAKAAKAIAPRIDGNFTGTTQEILRWTACKWGIDENIVYAQAAVESWWRQDTLGDFGTDASACPPGHGLGADGKAGQCPQSYGVLQDRWPYMKSGWPGYGRSTAMAADVAYGIWRSCYDGYETWLNTVDRGQPYRSGDVWGCVGRWFSGRWHTSASDGYVTKVKQYESQQIWKTPNFQQP